MHTTQRYDDGSYYVGQVNEKGERHGYGTLKWTETKYFEGKWSYGVPCNGTFYHDGYRYEGKFLCVDSFSVTGEGTSYYENGEIYIGNHYKGARSCKGTYYYLNGDISKGFWVEGELSEGKFIYSHGGIYKGKFIKSDNSFVTYDGVETTWDDYRYEGKFVNGKYEGTGKFYDFKNVLAYRGEFKNGLLHGKAKIYYINGNIFEGSYNKGKREGTGILTTATGVIKGNFVNGFLEGKVTEEHYFNNKIYVSNYEKGKIIEQVSETTLDPNRKTETLLLKDGSKYIGEVKKNKPNGIGILYLNADDDTKYYCGNFVNGKIHGKGICELEYFKYEGDFKKGKVTGRGTMWYTERPGRIEGSFKNGAPRGYVKFFDFTENMKRIEGIYKKGFKGKARIIHSNNSIYYGKVKGFMAHGVGKELYPDGSMVIGNFKYGTPEGPVTIIENKKKYEGYYKKGKLIKKQEWILDIKKIKR